jgi:spoIIIJ-associated protein
MDNDQETRDESWEAGDDTLDEATDTDKVVDPAEEILPSDERTKQALEFVVNVVREMELDCKVRLRRPKEGDSPDEINIEIYGPDAGIAIGKKGQVLQALQFLTHRVVNRPTLEKRHVLVDAEGYRSRRDDSLASMAKRLGRQAVHEGKIITFEPMNPRDRRVVHMALAKFEGVITKSDGEGEDRRVQIIPVRRPTPQTESSGQN